MTVVAALLMAQGGMSGQVQVEAYGRIVNYRSQHTNARKKKICKGAYEYPVGDNVSICLAPRHARNRWVSTDTSFGFQQHVLTLHPKRYAEEVAFLLFRAKVTFILED